MARKPNNKKAASASPLFENFNFEPKTQTQAEAAYEFDAGKNLILTGYAGTGKTYIALAFALQALLQGSIRHIHIVRSAVSGRDIGFLPGSEEEKMKVYEKAIRLVFKKLLRRDDAYECLKHAGMVSFGSTSFERGLTYDSTCIIVDEFQNANFQELDTMVTRLSGSSRVIFCGDTRQTDLRSSQSGFQRFIRISENVKEYLSRFDFGVDDIVRGGLVKAWIIAAEDDAAKNNPT